MLLILRHDVAAVSSCGGYKLLALFIPMMPWCPAVVTDTFQITAFPTRVLLR
jgi:formylmethanofuran dehydrogenase subunit D